MSVKQLRLSGFGLPLLLLLLLSIALSYATPEERARLSVDAPTPDIEVTPSTVEVTLHEGESTTVPLTLTNTGAGELTFSISKEQGSTGAEGQGGQGDKVTRRQGDKVTRRREPALSPPKGDKERVSPSPSLPLSLSPPLPLSLSLPHRVDPALWDALEAAPDGQATFLVYLKKQADLSPAYNIHDWKARGEFVYYTLQETAQRSQKELLAELQQQKSAGALTDYRSFFIFNAITVTGGRSAVEALAAHPDVVRLISDFGFDGQPVPQFTIHNSQFAIRNSVEWNIAQIGADRVWDELGVTGEGVVVASIDTGVDYTHPALVNQYRGTNTGSHDYNWYDPTGTYPTAPGDNHGHGTYVTGLMVGDDGGGNQIGVAPGAQWIAAKGCAGDHGRCAGTDLLSAAEWMLAPCPIGVKPGDDTCDPAKRPQVINNSWGSLGGDLWVESTVRAWRAAGIFPAFAAGDWGPDDGTVGSPGDYAVSFATGATDQADTACWFSGRGPSNLTPETKPDVTAPGCQGIRSALPGGSYGAKNGTAMAGSHTAGVVALLLQANPNLTLRQIDTLLISTAVDLGPEGPDKSFGYGRINAHAAVTAANDPVPWLSFDPTSGSVEPGTQTTITVTLNAAGRPADSHFAQLVISSNDPDEPTVTVPVTLSVAPASPELAHIRVSNVRDVSATVSWITTRDADGQVYYGTSPAGPTSMAYDDRGAGTEDDVHHVTIDGLSPNTAYYFYVASDGTVDDNNGQYYHFTTGATLPDPGSDSVYGQVFRSDGVTPAADALVYLQVLDNDGRANPGQSGLLSGLTDSSGYWIDPQTGGTINLAAARTENGQSYFAYSEAGDAVRIAIQGAADCEGLVQVDTVDDSPAPDIVLSCLKMITLDITTGWSTFVLPSCIRLPGPFGTFNASDLVGVIQDANGETPEVCQWLPELGDWNCYLRGLPFNDFALEPCRPFFLRANRRSLLRLGTGICIAPCNEVITLSTGWNFVALPRTAGVMTAEAACEQIAAQGGAASKIDRWDANTGDMAGHICGLPFGDFQMTPDEGYFIKSEADSTWCPAASDE